MKPVLLVAALALAFAGCYKDEEDPAGCDNGLQHPVNIIYRSIVGGNNLLDKPARYGRDTIWTKTLYSYRLSLPDTLDFTPARFDTTGGNGIAFSYKAPTNCPSAKNDTGLLFKAAIKFGSAYTDTFTAEWSASRRLVFRYNEVVIAPVRSLEGVYMITVVQ